MRAPSLARRGEPAHHSSFPQLLPAGKTTIGARSATVKIINSIDPIRQTEPLLASRSASLQAGILFAFLIATLNPVILSAAKEWYPPTAALAAIQMKWLLLIPLLLTPQIKTPQFESAQFETAQFETGSVVFVFFSPEDLTISADSRTTTPDGRHSDIECKISAFGNKFVFTMAGAVFRNLEQNPHVIARRVWQRLSSSESGSPKLTELIAEQWATEMESVYQQAAPIDALRQRAGNILANALFAATDDSGQLSLVNVNIIFDRPALDSAGELRTSHNLQVLRQNSWAAAGDSEIIGEYMRGSTDRARLFLNEVQIETLLLPSAERRAVLAQRLIEKSILLHPQRIELGLPVDLLQMKPLAGITWRSVKPNCPQN